MFESKSCTKNVNEHNCVWNDAMRWDVLHEMCHGGWFQFSDIFDELFPQNELKLITSEHTLGCHN